MFHNWLVEEMFTIEGVIESSLYSLFPDNQTEEKGACPHGPPRGARNYVGAWRGGGQLWRRDLRDAERTQRGLQRCGRGHEPAQRPEQRAAGQATWTQRLAREEPLPALRPPLAQPAPAPRKDHTCQISQKWRWGSQSRVHKDISLRESRKSPAILLIRPLSGSRALRRE